MPKVKPLGSEVMKNGAAIAKKMAALEPAEDSRISADLRALRARLRLTHKEISSMLGMDMRTWERRVAEPSTLSLPEIRRIIALAELYGQEIEFVGGVVE